MENGKIKPLSEEKNKKLFLHAEKENDDRKNREKPSTRIPQ